jgi:hypothetical protein
VRADEVVAELGVNVKSAQPVFHLLLSLRGRLCVISQLQSHGAIFTNAPVRIIATLAHLPAQSTTNTQDATCSGTRRRLEPNCPSENLSLRAPRDNHGAAESRTFARWPDHISPSTVLGSIEAISSQDVTATPIILPLSTGFPFFRLPPELWDEVYAYVSLTESV